MVRFFFKALFDVVKIRGWLDFEGGVYTINTHVPSIMSLFVFMYNVCAHTHIVVDPVPRSVILKEAFIGMSWLKHVATFQGRQDFKEWQDFEEIRYIQYFQY